MFVTEVLSGRAYQSFVPDPLFPTLEADYLYRFKDLDEKIKLNIKRHDFDERCIRAVLQSQNSISSSGREEPIRLAHKRIFHIKKINKADIIAYNSIITEHVSTNYRRCPVWVGGVHPAVSRHVGSPVATLDPLMKRILKESQTYTPITLAAFVSLVRFLQIHPFVDGNGRTGRFYFCWLLNRRLGPSSLYLQMLDKLWCRADFDLQSSSYEISVHEQWESLLNFALQQTENLSPP